MTAKPGPALNQIRAEGCGSLKQRRSRRNIGRRPRTKYPETRIRKTRIAEASVDRIYVSGKHRADCLLSTTLPITSSWPSSSPQKFSATSSRSPIR